MILAFDVGGTFIKWALLKQYSIVSQGKVFTPQDTFENFLKSIESIVDKFDKQDIEGLAFSLPGTMNKKEGQILIGGALRYNDYRYFVREVSNYFNLPVSMENDANSAALAEIKLGHLKDSENGLMIVIGTSVGAVYVHHGEIIRGSHGYGGEISFIPTKDIKTTPFKNAILGNEIGMKPFIAKAQKELNKKDLTGETFMQLVENNNNYAIKLLEEYMDVFAQTLFTLQIVYDPDHIVIGGGISENKMYMFYLKNAVQKYFSYCPVPMPYAEIVPSTFYNNSNLIGAVVSFYQQLGEL